MNAPRHGDAEPELIVDQLIDGVLCLALNRPKALNAITLSLACELLTVLHAAEADDQVRVIVLIGSGDRAFSAGYDIQEMAAMDSQAMVDALVQRFPLTTALATHRKPVVAALNGLAYGAGALLAAAADIRVAAAHAEFRIAATHHGAAEGCWLLPGIIGVARAKEILMTGRPVGMAEAQSIGLVHSVVADGEVRRAAMDAAKQIAAHPARGPQAVKRLINEGVGRDVLAQQHAELLALCTDLRPAAGTETFGGFLKRKHQ